ncbi:MAG: SigE family RNA polymerase sigma factor [Nocardioides sp.]
MARPPTDADFSEFVRASWPRLYRTAYLMLGDHGTAEDLVQTALSKTYATWGKVRTLDAAPGYARTVMINTAASWFRKKSWRNEQPTEVLPESNYQDDLNRRPMLGAALAQLAPRQRAVIVLRYYEDLDVRQTAHALGCSPGTVKSQTSDGISQLRRILGDIGVTDIQGALS